MRRLLLLVGVGACCVAGLGSASRAAPAATADLDVVFLTAGLPSTFVENTPFNLQLSVGNRGPDPTHYRVHMLLPTGLHLSSPGSLQCTGTTDLTCADGTLPPGPGPGSAADASALFVADAAGSYTLTAQLTELTATDPNPANNQASITVNVVAATPTPPTPPALVASRLSIKPTRPLAGRPLMVSFRVTDSTSGTSVKPSSVACTANLGTRTARIVNGAAACVLHPPATAHGKTLRGTLTAKVKGVRLSKRFSVHLR
jgi:Domain of unknown function DUF11